MSRTNALGILAGSAVLVVGTALLVVVGILSGVWTPRGALTKTPTPAGGGPGGIQIGARSYGEFLEDVRAGRVVYASQHGELVQVQTVDSAYTVTAPAEADVFSEVSAAAESGGVEPPQFEVEGAPAQPRMLAYDSFLAEVKAGRIGDVTQQGSQLQVSGERGEFVVDVPAGVTDVLGDIEHAAHVGRVPPPYYSKVPQ